MGDMLDVCGYIIYLWLHQTPDSELDNMLKAIMAYGKSGEFQILFFVIIIRNPGLLYDTMCHTVHYIIYNVWSTELTISHCLLDSSGDEISI